MEIYTLDDKQEEELVAKAGHIEPAGTDANNDFRNKRQILVDASECLEKSVKKIKQRRLELSGGSKVEWCSVQRLYEQECIAYSGCTCRTYGN